MKYRIQPTLLALAVGLSSPTVAIASGDGGSAAQEKAIQTLSSFKDRSLRTEQEVSRVVSALQNFYTKNGGTWPTNLAATSPYYSGNFQTPAGTISGSQSGSGYTLTIAVRGSDPQYLNLLSSMASKNGGNLTGTNLIFNVLSPNQYASNASVLSRFEDVEGGGERNKLHTSLNMNSKDITNVANLDAQTADFSTGTIDSLTSTNVNVTNATVNGQTVTNATITNNNVAVADYTALNTTMLINNGTIDSNATIQANQIIAGGNIVANGAGQLHYEGQNLDSRYLNLADTAKDTAKLGGVDAAQYLRRNAVNNYAHRQTFNGGMTISGKLTSSSLNATNVNISSSFNGSSVRGSSDVKIRGQSLKNYTHQNNVNVNTINYLKSKVAAGSNLVVFN